MNSLNPVSCTDASPLCSSSTARLDTSVPTTEKPREANPATMLAPSLPRPKTEMFMLCRFDIVYRLFIEGVMFMDLLNKRIEKIRQDYRLFTNMGVAFRRLFRDDRRLACFYLDILPKKRDLAFDIGANRGNYSKVLASIFKRVVAVEPQNRLFPEIKRNTRHFDNICFLNCAVSDHEGVANMFLSKNHELSSLNEDWMHSVKKSGRFSGIRWDENIEVPTTTLKHLIQRFGVPDFVKVDTEGNEKKCFQVWT